MSEYIKNPMHIYEATIKTPDGKENEQFVLSNQNRNLGEQEVIDRINKEVRDRVSFLDDFSREDFNVTKVKLVTRMERA